jgi:hypothetical protein
MPLPVELGTPAALRSTPCDKRRATLARAAGARLLLTALAAAGASTALAAQSAPPASVIYVDSRIPDASCDTYKPTARTCAGGRDTAVNRLAAAATRAQAGTTVLIREGVYHEPLVPGASGTVEQPIVFKNFERETATLSNIDAPAIQIIGRQHIVVDGLTVVDTTGWARLQDARENAIQHMTFKRAGAHGTTGGLKIVRSVFNRISENRFDEGNDSVMIQDESNGNVVTRNVFTNARHTLICIKCSTGNIVRANVFANATQKAMEIFDCEGGSDAPRRFDSTKRNVVEENLFVVTREAWNEHDYNAIQHGGQLSIVRRNVFLHNLGGAVAYQSYPEESLFVYGNRLYHNTFYDNRCFAVIGYAGDAKKYGDNRATNNLFYKNHDCQGRGDQVSIADRGALIMSGNAVESKDPGFVDEVKLDLHLKADSPMIDRGGPLTTARSAGEGTTMPVDDVLWFSDGFTIPGEKGDEIQLLGTTDTARVVRIDYKARALVLDHPLTWKAGQGVALKFTGRAPDMGALEYGEETNR